MIRIEKNDVQFHGSRIDIMTDLMVAMVAFIQTEPFGVEVGRQMLRDVEKHAEMIAGRKDAHMFEVSKLNEALKKIKETEAES